MTVALLLVLVGSIAGTTTGLVWRQAERLRLVQVPNSRSSHVRPTPHGGGVGIVLGGTVAGLWLVTRLDSSLEQAWAVLGLSLVIAAVGLRDDIRPVSAVSRFSMQVTVCALLLSTFQELPSAEMPFGFVVGGTGLLLLLSLVGVWWINLFNFMDGIDGIAGSQAVFMLVMSAGLGAWFQPEVVETTCWLWLTALAAATIGFLGYNWPPARIFMGDVGSTYLAFMLFTLALAAIRAGWLTYSAWLVLAALFVADTTVTLLRRMLVGERWFEAHRSHAYQRLARCWGSHRWVTWLAIGINVFWLGPLTWASLAWPQWAWGWVLLAYAPLVTGSMALGAGKQDTA